VAQRLERPIEERLPSVRLDVIDIAGQRVRADLQALGAPRVLIQLRPPDPCPLPRSIQLPVILVVVRLHVRPTPGPHAHQRLAPRMTAWTRCSSRHQLTFAKCFPISSTPALTPAIAAITPARSALATGGTTGSGMTGSGTIAPGT
jgi:hypothetical protein